MSQLEYKTYLLKHARKQNKGAGYTQDSERLKTYQSEWAYQRRVEIPQFKDIKEAQKFAKKIYKSKTWQKLWNQGVTSDATRLFASNPKVVQKERSSGRGTSGFTNGYTVTLDSIAGFDAYTLIHELTHCLGHMHHGRSFRKTLLSMVGVFLGAEHKKILKEEFKNRKLAFGEARKPLSYEQWMAARERMEKMRNG
jgi:hypothetical protein